MSTLTVDHVARIEGHGTINVEVKDGVVTDVRMDVVEPARLFEKMLLGCRFDEAPVLTSRICGICSPNHAITSVKAVEAALGIEVSERTEMLRELAVYGSFIQNHAVHLYVFAAPDYLGQPGVIPLIESHPDVVRRALRLKHIGAELTTLIAGRSVHPVTPVIGGFTREPARDTLMARAVELLGALKDVVATVELLASFDAPRFETGSEMLALVSPERYAIYDGETCALDAGWCRPPSEYREFITETGGEGGGAKHATVGGRPFMVGALARMNLSWDRLLPSARELAESVGLTPGDRNVFSNNLCQAVELADAVVRCAMLCQRLATEEGSSAPVSFEMRAGSGVAATEAPRGTLYHSISVDDDGSVIAGDIVTPTAQNLASIEADIRAFAPTIAHLSREEFVLRIEQLVRAYDPCLSCAVH